MSIYDSHKPASGEGGLYLKIADGETVKLRLASEPAIFEAESERDGKTTLNTRYGWLVYNQEAKVAQILQGSATFFKQIAALAQDSDWGDPMQYDIKVSRKGAALETVYTILPSNSRDILDDEAKSAIKAIDLLEKLAASPYSQRVMWLSEYDQAAAQPKSKSIEGTPPAKVEKPKDDVVIEDIGDEPINLDDIPF